MIKTGQTVKILTGKDRGKTGQVIQVFPSLDKVVVEGVNKSFKHLKRQAKSRSEKGQRVEFFAPIHLSNVVVIEEKKAKTPKKETKETPSKKKKA